MYTETAVNMLHSLFSKIWEKEEVPAQWKEGIVIKLPKKGDLRDCSNYRGIMLLSVPGKVLNRILLERMREAVDPMLRDQQAGFRRSRSCADQIASLRIIVEQSLEWNSPLYLNFIDYEKAFDSVDREALWKLLRHYGVPGKIISLIQCTYQDMSCRISHAGQLSESFEVKTGVRQGCLLSPFLFLLVIDWIMKTTTAGRKNGIQWTLWTQLDDLDFADDLALLSHSHSQMQDKTTCLEATSAGTGLKINRKKTELMKINTTANTPVTVGGEPIREVESFVYLGSVVDGQGGTDRDVTARIGKARAAMVMLKNVWASKVVSIRTKLRIFNSNVKSVLLYGCETWRTTKTMQQKIQTFLNTCLRRIFNIRWPEKIRNEELWERAGQEPVAKQILRRKWGWIGHTLRKPASSTTRQALTWNPQGKRKRGRPRNSWRRDTEAELLVVVVLVLLLLLVALCEKVSNSIVEVSWMIVPTHKVGWLVLVDRQYLTFALLLLALSTACSLLSLGMSYYTFDSALPILQQENRRFDIWAIRLCAHNSMAFLAVWLTLYMAFNFSLVLAFEVDTPVALSTSAIVELSCVAFLIFCYTLADLTIFDKFSRYVLLPYVAFVVFLASQIFNLEPSAHDPVFLMLSVMQALSFLLLLLKVIVSAWRHVARSNSEKRMVTVRPLAQDEQSYLLP
nr:hypothetical protein BaRGS_017187 [Batillaria attramentaria]